jgi:hypothetical protein
MKLIDAIKTIEERERIKGETFLVLKSEKKHQGKSIEGMIKIVHVQSVLPEEDAKALKIKTRESSIKEAVSKAVYHYLNCQKTDDDEDDI